MPPLYNGKDPALLGIGYGIGASAPPVAIFLHKCAHYLNGISCRERILRRKEPQFVEYASL